MQTARHANCALPANCTLPKRGTHRGVLVLWQTFHQLPFELPQLLIAANIGTLAVMIPFVLRLRVGWASV